MDFPADSRVNCLDPCCGTGEALYNLCPGQNLYGIELDVERGLKARELLHQVLIGDFEGAVVQNTSFGFLFLNPPYDWKTGTEGQTGQRYEIIFLNKSLNYLAHRGVLCFIIPQNLIETRAEVLFRIIYENFEDIRIYRYPEPEFREFKQYVVFGVKKRYERVVLNPETAIKIANEALKAPVLEEQESSLYQVPKITQPIKIFRINFYNQELAEKESNLESFLKELKPQTVNQHLTAPYYLDKALLALLSAGGYIDGKMPGHYLSGRYSNSTERVAEVEDEKLVNKERKTSSTVFYILTKKPDKHGSRVIKLT